MPKLVFSRCLGKPSTATRHLGPKTGTVLSVRENPSKSPKRPALPGAVNREGAVSRHRPFLLLVFHTLSAALIRVFFGRRETRCFSAGKDGCRAPEVVLLIKSLAWSCTQVSTRAFWGLGWVLSPPWGETPHTGPHGAQQAGMGSSSGSGVAELKKDRCLVLPGSGCGVMIVFAVNLQFLPHPPVRTGTWHAVNQPVPWRSPSPTGWR